MTDDPASRQDLKAVWKSQPQELPPMVFEKLRRDARRLQRRNLRIQIQETLAALIVVGIGAVYVRYLPGALVKISSGLMMVWALYYIWLVRRAFSPGRVPDDAAACLDFHRHELVRRLYVSRTSWRWVILPLLPIIALMTIGRWIGPLPPGRSVFADHLIIIVASAFVLESFLLAALWMQHRADKWQDRIDELDALRRTS